MIYLPHFFSGGFFYYTIMNYRIIFTTLLIFSSVLAQKAKGFPAAETDIYKIIKVNNDQKDSLLYVGSGKDEVKKVLGQPKIDRNNDDNGDDWGYAEMALGYTDNYPENYDVLMIDPKADGSPNPYVISKKYKLGIGRPIPKELLNSVEYGVYTKASPGKPLTPAEEAALPQATWRQYSFNIAAPDGTLSDFFLSIGVQDGKIIKLYIGY